MTVSIPLSRMPPSQPTSRAAATEAAHAPMIPGVSSSARPVVNFPWTVNGPVKAISVMICMAMTTVAVNPRVAFGLVRM
jgi:hypothetical protein